VFPVYFISLDYVPLAFYRSKVFFLQYVSTRGACPNEAVHEIKKYFSGALRRNVEIVSLKRKTIGRRFPRKVERKCQRATLS